MFITGPEVVKTVTGEEVTFEELGGAVDARVEVRRRPLHRAADEEAALEDARYLLSFLPQNNLEPPPFAEPTDPTDREDPELDSIVPDNPNKPYDMRDVIDAHRRRRRASSRSSRSGREHRLRLRAARRPPGRDRREQPACARRHPRHRLLGQGRPLRPLLRRLQRPARHLRRRSRLPPGHSAGVGRHHPARRQAPLRLLRGDRPEDRRHHAQGLRRRLRRHELEAHPRRLQLRLADRRDRRDGPGGRGQHRLPQGARAGRRPRRRGAPS